MNYEKSCGAVVFTRTDEGIKYVLVQNKKGVYGFPKGHIIKGETELQTARREIWEETGLVPQFIEEFREEEDRPVPTKENTMKNIVFFLAEYKDQQIVPLLEETSSVPLVSLEEAIELLPQRPKEVIISADRFIKEHLL